MGYGVDVVVDAKKGEEEEDRPVVVEVFRAGRGGVEMGERVRVGEGGVEVRVLRAREYYEARSGCKWSYYSLGCGWRMLIYGCGDVVSPLSLLKNPMILIAIVGLGFVFGMPYLLDNSTPFPPSRTIWEYKRVVTDLLGN